MKENEKIIKTDKKKRKKVEDSQTKPDNKQKNILLSMNDEAKIGCGNRMETRLTRSKAKMLNGKNENTNDELLQTNAQNSFPKSSKRRCKVFNDDEPLNPKCKRQRTVKKENKKDVRNYDAFESQTTQSTEKKSKRSKELRKKVESHASGSSSTSKIDKERADQIAVIDFREGEVVWAKLRGFPCWPAQIENFFGEKRQTVRIKWFNDYRISNVSKNQIFKFYKYFEEFSKPFATHVGLETAAKEALIYLGASQTNTF